MARIIGISSGKGGVGKSTLASNLALALKSFDQRVTIVDCNLSTPHLSYYLGVDGYKATLNDVLRGKIHMDEAIYNYNGIRYVPASLKLEDLTGIDLAKFSKAMRQLASPEKANFVILDSAPGLGNEAVNVLNASDEIIFVTTPFVSAVNDVIRSAEVVKEIGSRKLSIVLNMTTGKKHELTPETVEKLTGIPVIGCIPLDKSVVQSMVFGSPVLSYSPGSAASIEFMRIAARLADVEYRGPSMVDKFFARLRSLVFNNGLRMQQGEEASEEFIGKAA